MSIILGSHGNNTDSGGSVGLTLNVLTNERVIICLAVNDLGFGPPTGITVDDTSGSPLTMTLISSGQSSPNVNGAVVRSEIWSSSINTGASGNRSFKANIFGSGSFRNIIMGVSVAGINTNDVIAYETDVVNFGVATTIASASLNPIQIPNSLRIGFWTRTADLVSNPIVSGPTNLFTILESAYQTGSPGGFAVDGVLGYRITSVGGQSGITYTSSAYFVVHGAVFAGAVETTKQHTTDSRLVYQRTKQHNTDSYLKAIVTKQHNTDSFLKITDVVTKQHDTDTLLKFIQTKQHDSDSYLKATIDKIHTTDTLLSALKSKYHATDSYLQAHKSIQHTTDILINFTREQELKKLISNTIPVGNNIGAQTIRILGVNGNDQIDNAFTYEVNPQEFVIGANGENKLNIIDPIVKKGL